MTYTQLRDESVLSAKLRIACVAQKNYEAFQHGEQVNDCCVQKVLFTYGLLKDLECYDLTTEANNCYDFDDFLIAVGILNQMLV